MKNVQVAVLLAAMLTGACGDSSAWAQHEKPSAASPTTWAERVAQVNERAEQRFRAAEKHWRERFASLRQKERFRQAVRQMISGEEKLRQAGNLFSNTKEDRVLKCLRTHLVDEHELTQEMARAFEVMQQDLLNESTELLMQSGMKREVAEFRLPKYGLNPAPWVREFAPFFATARKLSQEDWYMTGGVFLGAGVTSKLLRDAGRETGTYTMKKGSFGDFIVGLALEAAAAHIAEKATDPTETYAAKLQADFISAERRLLDGRQGLLPCLRMLTDKHQERRKELFGLEDKGVGQ